MSCFVSFGRVFLVVFNLIFLLLGIALLTIGIIFHWNADLILKSNIFEADIKPVLTDVSIPGAGNLYVAMQSLNIAVIAIGAVIFVLGFLGFYGACCKVKCLLVTYASLVIVILIGQVVILAFFGLVKNDFSQNLHTVMIEQIPDYKYDSPNPEADDISVAYNFIFETLQCCGVDNYKDLHNSTWYKDQTPPKQDFPTSCCANPDYGYTNCSRTDGQNNKAQGCFNAIESSVSKFSTIFIATGAGLLVFELLCVIFACCLCRHDDKEGLI